VTDVMFFSAGSMSIAQVSGPDTFQPFGPYLVDQNPQTDQSVVRRRHSSMCYCVSAYRQAGELFSARPTHEYSAARPYCSPVEVGGGTTGRGNADGGYACQHTRNRTILLWKWLRAEPFCTLSVQIYRNHFQ